MNLGLVRNLQFTEFSSLMDGFQTSPVGHDTLLVSALPLWLLLFNLLCWLVPPYLSTHLILGCPEAQAWVLFVFIYSLGDLLQLMSLNTISVFKQVPTLYQQLRNYASSPKSPWVPYLQSQWWYSMSTGYRRTCKRELLVVPSKPAPLSFLISEYNWK